MDEKPQLIKTAHKAVGLFAIILGLYVIIFAVNYASSTILLGADAGMVAIYGGVVFFTYGIMIAFSLGFLLLAFDFLKSIADAYKHRR